MTVSPSTSIDPAGRPGPRAIPSGIRAEGRVEVPPSKSVTHRFLNLALLASAASPGALGSTSSITLENPLDAEDTRLFLRALEAVGFAVERGEREVRLALGPRALPVEDEAPVEIFCGNAGTMFRFLAASLAAIPGRFRLDGTPRLRERPVGPLVEAVRRLGGEVDYLGQAGFPPLAILGGTLRGGTTTLDAGSSSQYLSALLMAGLAAREPVGIELAALTSEPYVDVTLAVAEAFGGRIERPSPTAFRVHPSPLSLDRARVEGDWSAAAYPAAMAVLTGGRVRLEGLSERSAQGDRAFLDLLVAMGGEAVWANGELTVSGTGRLRAAEADLSRMPDQVPTLAALAPFASGVTRIGNVRHLRIKESDRLHAMATGLRALGAEVDEHPDGLDIPGVWAEAEPPGDPVAIETFDDHRIAMSFALVGLRRPGVAIVAPGVVAKSYPEFWRDFERLTAPR